MKTKLLQLNKLKTKLLQLNKLKTIFFIAITLSICLFSCGDSIEPPPPPVEILTKIDLDYYFDSSIIEKVNPAFVDTVVKWSSFLSKEFELKYEFKSYEVSNLNFSTPYDSSKVQIHISAQGGNPSYNIEKHYIRIPYTLFRDPIILTHEIIHYINASHLHVIKDSVGWIYSGCIIKENGCLNLMRSSRDIANPYTFLLSEEQKNIINNRKGETGSISCAESNYIFNKFPISIIETEMIETLVNCCRKIEFTKEEMKAYFEEYEGKELNDSIAEFTSIYYNDLFEKLLEGGLCPNSIISEDLELITPIILPETQNKQPANIPLDSISRLKFNSYNTVMKLIRMASFKNKNDEEIKSLFKSESEYLGEIFKVEPEKIEDIRLNSFEYMENLRVSETQEGS